MARARNLKPGFFTNELLAECEPLARIFFEGLWCHADREGRLEWRPKKLKAEILPYDQCNVSDFLGQLIKHGFIVQYECDGKTFLQVVNFGKHQNPHVKEAASTIPAPGQHQTSTIQAGPLTDSLLLIPSSSTEARASSADARETRPLDAKVWVFGDLLQWLIPRTGRSEASLRAWLGKCCGKYGDNSVVAAGMMVRAPPEPVDPISAMTERLERQAGNGRTNNQKYSVDSDDIRGPLVRAAMARTMDAGSAGASPPPASGSGLEPGPRRAGAG